MLCIFFDCLLLKNIESNVNAAKNYKFLIFVNFFGYFEKWKIEIVNSCGCQYVKKTMDCSLNFRLMKKSMYHLFLKITLLSGTCLTFLSKHNISVYIQTFKRVKKIYKKIFICCSSCLSFTSIGLTTYASNVNHPKVNSKIVFRKQN